MLQINHLTLTHRKDLRPLLTDFDLVLNPGDKAVIVGEEGNGKSTLLKWIYDPALVADYVDAEGLLARQGEKLGYLPQEPELDDSKTVAEVVGEGAQLFLCLVLVSRQHLQTNAGHIVQKGILRSFGFIG